MKKMNLLITSLLSFGAGVLLMLTFFNKGTVNPRERIVVESIFSSGCEVGIMKYCDPKKVSDCRNFCILFVETHPQIIDLLLEGLAKNAK